MSSRSQAYASYLKEIYAQYDALAHRIVTGSLITLTTATTAEDNFEIIGDLAGADIEALIMVVMMQTAQDADQDLKAIMEEMKAAAQTKQRLRNALKRLREQAQAAEDDLRREYEQDEPLEDDDCAALDVDLVIETIALIGARQSDHEVRTLADELALIRERRRRAGNAAHDELDSLSELGEMQQMRLQMMLDRRSKLMETLSNILKKMAETQSSIIQNMK